MSIEEKKELGLKTLLAWGLNEDPKMEYQPHDKEFIESSFISKILLKKFEVFEIKIHLPIYLLLILSLCTDENPGMTQIVLKDLLLDIKAKNGPIPENYVITAIDFISCFEDSLPIMDIESIYEKYEKLWDGQKYNTQFGSNNLCDTPEWWKEVMV